MKKGFVSITIVMIMPILFLMALELGRIITLGDLILSSTANNIQSYYLSEDKTLMTIYEEKYYEEQLFPILLDVFRNNKFGSKTNEVIIDNNDLRFDDDINSVRVSFRDWNNRKELILEGKSDFRGLKSHVFASGTIVNYLFEMGDAILDLDTANGEVQGDLYSLVGKFSKDLSINNTNIPNTMYAMEYLNYNNIKLHKKDNSNFEISAHRNTMNDPYIERFDKSNILLIGKNNNNEPLNLYIGDPEKPLENIKLFGILYVEGNVTISCNLDFYGIIIVKDGEIVVESTKKPNISGLLITQNIRNAPELLNQLNLVYSSRYIYLFGTYLPGFLQPKINLIKST